MAPTDDYMRFFPKDAPYANQRRAMDRIHNALTRGQDVLFEGACGTGKTLAALVPALHHAREHGRTVVITTNVHQQMRQFVREAREITRTEPIRAVVFKGKASMCHIDVGFEECQALRDNTYEVVDAERDERELERRQRELLAQARTGDEAAAEARSAVMDELDAVADTVEERREETTCEYYYRNLTGDTDAFYEWLFEDVRTPDEIFAHAGERGFCGYELLKDGMEGVDLVVCNYHHLLDPVIREQFFRWLGRDPGDVIAVFDEAHNVEDAARDHATRTLTENTLDSALDELRDSDDPRAAHAHNVLGAFRRALGEVREAYLDGEFGSGEARSASGRASGPRAREQVGDDWTDVTVANDDRRDDLTLTFLREYSGRGFHRDLEDAAALGAELDEEYAAAYKRGESDTRRECRTLQAAEFVEAYLDESDATGRYPVVGLRRDEGTGEIYGRAELYTCIPEQVTSDLFGDVYASVLMSATLRPFDVFSDVVGLRNPVELAFGLQFPAENRRTFAVDSPPLFASERDDPEVQEIVGDALADAVTFTAGNALCFFPSYAEAARYHDRLADRLAADCYLDEPGTSAEELRAAFVESEGAALFTSLWGTLAEGVSFDGDDARAVAVVGVPYPRLDDRAKAVQDAYAEAFGDGGRGDPGWTYAVEIPTIRKTRQALGRVIRSPSEVGVRVLLDRRYTRAGAADLGKYSVHDSFPAEERDEMIDVAPGKLRYAMLNFFGDHDAWDGEPPTP